MGFNKFKNSFWKTLVRRRNPSHRQEKIFATQIADKSLVSWIYKNLCSSIIKNPQKSQLKVGKQFVHFMKKDIQMSSKHIKRCSASQQPGNIN